MRNANDEELRRLRCSLGADAVIVVGFKDVHNGVAICQRLTGLTATDSDAMAERVRGLVGHFAQAMGGVRVIDS